MKLTSMVAVLVGLSIVVLCFFPSVTHNASAWMVPNYKRWCGFPSANEADYAVSGGDPSSIPGPQILSDGNTYPDIYSRWVNRDLWYTSYDYSNPIYPVGHWLAEGTHNAIADGFLPPNNSTIISVWAVVVFEYPFPSMATETGRLSLSVDDGATWNMFIGQPQLIVFQGFNDYMGEAYNPYLSHPEIRAFALNITDQATWTPHMLSSHIRIGFSMTLIMMHGPFYLDYLGFVSQYKFNETTGGGGDGSVIPPAPEINLTLPSPLGIMGMVGFVGMIGVPAFGIWMAKRTDESKGILMIQVLIAFVVCLGLFLASIS